MNACPTFPATQFGLAFALMCRINAFLALCIRACGLGAIAAVRSRTPAWIVAFAARLFAVTRTVARLAERARLGTQYGARPASCGASRATLIDVSPHMGRAARWLAHGLGVMLRETAFPMMEKPIAKARAPADALVCVDAQPARGGQTRGCNPVATSQPDPEWPCPRAATRARAHANCEFSTGFRNWVRGLGSR